MDLSSRSSYEVAFVLLRCCIIRPFQPGIPVSGPGFSLALMRVGGDLATLKPIISANQSLRHKTLQFTNAIHNSQVGYLQKGTKRMNKTY